MPFPTFPALPVCLGQVSDSTRLLTTEPQAVPALPDLVTRHVDPGQGLSCRVFIPPLSILGQRPIVVAGIVLGGGWRVGGKGDIGGPDGDGH